MPTDNGYKTYDDGDWEQPDAPAERPSTITAAEFANNYTEYRDGIAEVYFSHLGDDGENTKQIVSRAFYQPRSTAVRLEWGVNGEISVPYEFILGVRWLAPAPVERLSTIKAHEWHKVMNAAKEHKCVVTWGVFIVEDIQIKLSSPTRATIYGLGEYSNEIDATDTLTVRWLASTPASEQDAAAYAEFEAGYQAADASALEVANRLIEQMRRDEKRLQAELTATQQQLAAAETRQLDAAWESFQVEENIDASYKNYKDETPEPLSKLAWLMRVCVGMTKQIHELNSQVFALQATPQPAPEASDLRAAVNWLITIAPADRPTLPSVDASKSVDAIASEFYAVGWAAATFGAAEKLKTALKAGE